MTFRAPSDIKGEAAAFIASFAANTPELAGKFDGATVQALAQAMQDADLLHPGGYIETRQAYGVLSDDGHTVQMVGDTNDPAARYYTTDTIKAPWKTA